MVDYDGAARRAGSAGEPPGRPSTSASACRRTSRCAASRPSRVLASLNYSAGGWESATVRVLPTNKVQVVTGASPARPGPRDLVVDDRGRAPRRRPGRRRGAALRHRAQRRWAWTPTARARWPSAASPSTRPSTRSSTRPSPSPPTCWRRPRTTSSSSRARSRCGAHPTKRGAAGRRWPSPPSPPTTCPTGMEPNLEAQVTYDPPNFSWPFGTHICVVEVDEETGARRRAEVRRRRRLRQPDQPDHRRGPGARRRHPGPGPGAVRGGRLRRRRQPHSRRRSPTTWCPPRRDVPSITTGHTITPSPTNPLGVKGIGEAGTIGAAPAVMNAVVDALSHLGVTDVAMPASPLRSGPPSRRQGRRLGTESPIGTNGTRRCVDDPRRVRLRAGRVGRPRHRLLDRARRRRQAHRRRPLAAAADEAAAGHAVGAHRRRPPRPTCPTSATTATTSPSAPAPATTTSSSSDLLQAEVAHPAPTPPVRSAIRRSATAAPSAARSPTPTRRRTCRRWCWRSAARSSPRARTANGSSPHGTSSPASSSRRSNPTSCSPRSACPRSPDAGWSFQKFNRRAPRTGPSSAWPRSATTARRRRPRQHGLDPDLRRRRGRRHAGRARRPPTRAERADEGTEPQSDINATAEYRRHLAQVLVRRALEEAGG